MGDLPMKKSFQGSEKYESFSKWSYCNGQPAQVKNANDFSKWLKIQMIFQSGLIIMDDMPR